MYRGMIIRKTPEQIEADGRRGGDPGPLPADARAEVPARRHHRRARQGRREVHPLAGRRARRSRATAASRARSAPRRTRWWSTGSRGPTSCAAATSSRSTSASPTRAGSPTPRSPSRSGRQPEAAKPARRRPATSLFDGVEQARPGNRLGDVSTRSSAGRGATASRSSAAWSATASAARCTRTRRSPTSASPGKGPELEEGMVLGDRADGQRRRPRVRMGDDGWAVYSQDDSPAAHFEFTVAVTADGPADPHPVARGLTGRAAGFEVATTAPQRPRRPRPPLLTERLCLASRPDSRRISAAIRGIGVVARSALSETPACAQPPARPGRVDPDRERESTPAARAWRSPGEC